MWTIGCQYFYHATTRELKQCVLCGYNTYLLLLHVTYYTADDSQNKQLFLRDRYVANLYLSSSFNCPVFFILHTLYPVCEVALLMNFTHFCTLHKQASTVEMDLWHEPQNWITFQRGLLFTYSSHVPRLEAHVCSLKTHLRLGMRRPWRNILQKNRRVTFQRK
jgi:hypothetical protein